MENKDIVALSLNELRDKIKEEKAVINKVKINHTVSPVENPMKIREARKLIARLSTELTKKQKATK
ncbi:MAG: ribosomal protein [Bacteroidetes bacterium]|jgi:large subunit ribosomal protein L29|nr:ribosomal protein [Bacteroidota bacterium]